MDTNAISGYSANITQTETYVKKDDTELYSKSTSIEISSSKAAAVFERSEPQELLTDTGYKVDKEKILEMKAEQEERMLDVFKHTSKDSFMKQIQGLKRFVAAWESRRSGSEESSSSTQVSSMETSLEIEQIQLEQQFDGPGRGHGYGLQKKGSQESFEQTSININLNINITNIQTHFTGDDKDLIDSEYSLADIEKAKTDVAEDGYWGADAVSSRLLDFAHALSGGDKSKAEILFEAVTAGFKMAEELWGGELPGLSQDTLALTEEKFLAWQNEDEVTAIEAQASNAFTAQAGVESLAGADDIIE